MIQTTLDPDQQVLQTFCGSLSGRTNSELIPAKKITHSEEYRCNLLPRKFHVT